MGSRASRRCVSDSIRSSLEELQRLQQATTFSQTCWPPRERGTTWSMLSALVPQYWQRCPSRMNTARRDSGARARYGTRTRRVRRITDGIGNARRSEWRTSPRAWTTSALLFSTSTTARRIGTTPSGSYEAFRTRERATVVHLRAGSLPAGPAGLGAPFQAGERLAPVQVGDDVVGFGRPHRAVRGDEP